MDIVVAKVQNLESRMQERLHAFVEIRRMIDFQPLYRQKEISHVVTLQEKVHQLTVVFLYLLDVLPTHEIAVMLYPLHVQLHRQPVVYQLLQKQVYLFRRLLLSCPFL